MHILSLLLRIMLDEERASQGCATPAASLPSDYMPACTVSILAAIQLNIYMSMPFQKTTI